MTYLAIATLFALVIIGFCCMCRAFLNVIELNDEESEYL